MARATVTQIAAEAGVSVAVVSLVLNGKDNGKFLPETVERVHETSRRLGYRVDRRAISLITGKSSLVALIIPDITNPFFAAVQMGVLDALGSDYQLLAMTSAPDDPAGKNNAETAVDIGVDGMLIMARESAIPSGIPTVILDLPGHGDGHARVNLDVGSSARELAKLMLEWGHQSVVYLEGDVPSATMAERYTEFTRVMEANGSRVEIVKSDLDIDSAEQLTTAQSASWLTQGHTAVVCATDIQAYGVLSSMKATGIAVPHQMSVVGGDDLPFSRLLTPPLASVTLPARELGRMGAELLLQEIRGEAVSNEAVLTLPTKLSVRDSLAPR